MREVGEIWAKGGPITLTVPSERKEVCLGGRNTTHL